MAPFLMSYYVRACMLDKSGRETRKTLMYYGELRQLLQFIHVHLVRSGGQVPAVAV